jgi:hypothetical protein
LSILSVLTRPLESGEFGKDQTHPLKIKLFEPDPLKVFIKFDSLVSLLGSVLEKSDLIFEDDAYLPALELAEN